MVSSQDREFFHTLFSTLSVAFEHAASKFVSENEEEVDDDLQDPVVHLSSEDGSEAGSEDADRNGLLSTTENATKFNSESSDYHSMQRSTLQKLCKSRKLKASGTTWQLIERLVASETAKPKVPKQALESFLLDSFERRSNSTHIFNPKCHSGKSMHLYMHICKDSPGGKPYLFCLCQCGTQCIRAWPLGEIEEEPKDPLTILFFAADTKSGAWINYPCKFKATFSNVDDVKRFKVIFAEITQPFEYIPPDDDDQEFQFQSQNILF